MLVVDVRQGVSTRERVGRGRQEGVASSVRVVTSVGTWDVLEWDQSKEPGRMHL